MICIRLSHSTLGAVLLCAAACGSANRLGGEQPINGEAKPEAGAERYFPLRDGTIYQYATTQSGGGTGVMVLTIKREGDRATLSTGNSIQQLQIRDDAILNDAGYYHIKLPISTGTTWPGSSGPVRVTNAHRSIEVEAGKFSDCIETEEQTQATVEVRTTRSVYCPGVGLVSLEVEADSGGVVTRESAKLRYYGAKINIDDL
jgi:hypothetical protein